VFSVKKRYTYIHIIYNKFNHINNNTWLHMIQSTGSFNLGAFLGMYDMID